MIQYRPMIYLDYAANYPVKKEVLETLCQTEMNYRGNANSLHEEGRQSFLFYEECNHRILTLLHLDPSVYEVIYTSSATESNNTVLKGLFQSYSGFSNLILSSEFEHSSVNGTLAYLKDLGAQVELVSTNKDGKLNLEDLSEKIKRHPLVTCLSLVEGEVGTIQDYQEVCHLLHERKAGYLLLDATQAVGKIPLDFTDVDFITFTPHKFGGLTGTGLLIKKKEIVLTPLIHGGKSLSLYRSGSPAIGLIASTAKALELAISNQEDNFRKVKELSSYLVERLKENPHIQMNSFLENPYIVNISYKGSKASQVVSYLNEKGICVSQKSACSVLVTPSKVINAIYHDKQRASSSFRISLSELVKKEELDLLIQALGEYQNGR